jgi:hypothetical protein
MAALTLSTECIPSLYRVWLLPTWGFAESGLSARYAAEQTVK